MPGSKDLAGLNRVMTQLQREKAARPSVTVTAEKVFDALSAKGIKLTSAKQVLASTAGAEYCALGITDSSIGIAVCEYSSPEAAREGKKLIDTRYAKLVPDAVRRINGSTLVTVSNGRSHSDVREQILTTFSSI